MKTKRKYILNVYTKDVLSITETLHSMNLKFNTEMPEQPRHTITSEIETWLSDEDLLMLTLQLDNVVIVDIDNIETDYITRKVSDLQSLRYKHVYKIIFK